MAIMARVEGRIARWKAIDWPRKLLFDSAVESAMLRPSMVRGLEPSRTESKCAESSASPAYAP